MDHESSLLAHLVPRLRSQGEDTATDALAHILNKSKPCRRALGSLLSEQDFDPGPLTSFETQVTYEDGSSRPDMVGYDSKGRARLLVESKFWAALQPEQASRYFSQLEDSRPGMLLFIAPGSRLETLWAEIGQQMEAADYGVQSESAEEGLRRAKVTGSDNRLMLVSWDLLLERCAAAASGDWPISSDIHQLRGFVKELDMESFPFQPFQPGELDSSLARKILGLEQLIDDVVARGDGTAWNPEQENIKYEFGRFRAYGRYFTPISGNVNMWLGVQFWMWARRADTPLWLWIDRSGSTDAPMQVLQEDDGLYVPIRLPEGPEAHRAVDDVFGQVLRAVSWSESSEVS